MARYNRPIVTGGGAAPPGPGVPLQGSTWKRPPNGALIGVQRKHVAVQAEAPGSDPADDLLAQRIAEEEARIAAQPSAQTFGAARIEWVAGVTVAPDNTLSPVDHSPLRFHPLGDYCAACGGAQGLMLLPVREIHLCTDCVGIAHRALQEEMPKRALKALVDVMCEGTVTPEMVEKIKAVVNGE